MKRTTFALIFLGLSVYVFIWLLDALPREGEMELWDGFYIDKGFWGAAVLKFYGVAFIGGPITVVIYELIAWGMKRSDPEDFQDAAFKKPTLRLSWVMRWLIVILVAGILAIMYWDISKDPEPWKTWIFVSPLVVFFLYAAIYTFAFSITFDNHDIISTKWHLGKRTYSWHKLENIRYLEDWQEHRFYFEGQGWMRVSIYMSNRDNLLNMAFERLGKNHPEIFEDQEE